MMTHKCLFGVFIALLLTLTSVNSTNNTTCSCVIPPALNLAIFPSHLAIEYYSNIDLTQKSNIITRATNVIFSIHGTDRDADDYFCAMKIAAQLNGYNVDNYDIIIIAPRFQEAVDNPSNNQLFWDNGWKGGSNSIVSNVPDSSQVSSFTVIDKMIEYLFYNQTKYYPSLKNISIAGHSAGGQFVQRYALSSVFSFENDLNLINSIENNAKITQDIGNIAKNAKNIKNSANNAALRKDIASSDNNIASNDNGGTFLSASKGYNIQYIVANPSSFCYLSSKRWFDNTVFRELTNDEVKECADYNSWKYGWSDYANFTFPPYITSQNLTLDDVKERYQLRNVTYLHGTFDVCNSVDNSTCDDSDMDTGCEADLQGEFRLERGINYIRSLQEIYNETVHRIQLVPFVGHDKCGMFQSPNGRRSIFSGTQ